MASASALRWLERIAAVTLGSLLTAWWMRREPVDPRAERGGAADGAPTHAASVSDPLAARGRGDLGDAEGATARAGASSEERAAAASSEEGGAGALGEGRAAGAVQDGRRVDAAVEADADTNAEADAGDDAGAAPALPLPRMPGATRLSDAARFDAPSGTWVLRAAYRVHAHDHHVLSFYGKALADAGLEVTRAEDPPLPDGTVVAYLRGRSERVHAQVSVRTRGAELEARVGILWRVRG